MRLIFNMTCLIKTALKHLTIQDTSVRTVTVLQDELQRKWLLIVGKATDYSVLQHVQNISEAHPTSYPTSTGRFLPGQNVFGT